MTYFGLSKLKFSFSYLMLSTDNNYLTNLMTR